MGVPGSRSRIAAQSRASGSERRLDGPLLTLTDAALLLGVKMSWIYEAVRNGRLPAIRVGRHIRFTKAMLEEWLADL
jgi:excisionase family DNA binding protein